MTGDTRKRLALYGSAALLAAFFFAVPRFLTSRSGAVIGVREFDLPTALSHEASRMLVELVKIDTSNPPGITKPAVQLLAHAFDCEGIPYVIAGDDPERPILVARLAGRQRKGALLLLNHVDVEPSGSLDRWSVPPFAGEMGKGMDAFYLYGRGTLDMKGQAVAAFFAMAALARAGIVPMRDIVYVAEPGEETFTPEVGIGWVVDHRPDLLDGVEDVLNEGGVNETVTSDIRRFGIEVMQKATVNIWVEGKTEDDLKKLRDFLLATDAAQPYRLVGPVREFMQFIGPSRNDIWGRSMIEPERTLKATWFRQWAPEVYKALVRDAFYPGGIERRGDHWEMNLAATLLPGSSTAESLKRIDGWLAERGLTRRVRFITPDSASAPASGRAWDAMTTVLSLDGQKAEVGVYVLTVSYTNSSFLRARGYRAYGISPFNVNINDANKIHRENERIVLPYFVEGVERMERIVREFATSP